MRVFRLANNMEKIVRTFRKNRHMNRNKLFSAMLLMICFFSMNSIFADVSKTAVGRYLTTENAATIAQKDLLSQSIQVRFPQQVTTVGGAIHYLLRYSGYSLANENQQSTALKQTLSKPLPVIDRQLGPMPLREAFTTLAGPAFSLQEDPLNREINFQVKQKFRH